jgi:hypothetical protein
MFGKKKAKQKQKIVLINSAFGELRYGWGSWKLCTKPKVELWDTTYEVNCYVVSETEEEGISEKQETAWKKFNHVVVEQKNQIEEMIVKHSGSYTEKKVRDRYIPRSTYFSKNGECVLFVEDTYEDCVYDDDPDAGFAIFLVPKLMLYSSELGLDYMFGHTDPFTDKELYGDESDN